ncbi:MAG: T9SS type A sorting domain-containing protein, partial [Saprospiraceae bacterium]|nr:T9SS type A sorting domain-containing protein [Saprospiraceae bacterium]
GLGGPGNIGIEIVASPGNVYCCNTVGNTRLGVSVSGGSLATDNFRGTTFGNHAGSLYLPDVNAVLGSQSHTQNRWTGTGAAVYGVSQQIAAIYPFIVDITPPNGSPEYMPPSHSPQGWFIPVENSNSNPSDECAPEFCIIPGLTSGSEDDKRIIEGLPNAQAAVIWELQRFIFERVRNENNQDSTIQAFVLQNNQSNIGAFQHINDEVHDAWNGNSSDITSLKNELKLVKEKLDSLILLDGLITDPHNNAGILMQSRQFLSDGLFNLSLSCRDLSTDVSEDAIAQFEWLKPVNDSISAQTIFETNEKTVNGLYLNYAAQAMAPLTESELLALKMIAEQCPLTGGNAVYRARAFLAVANNVPLNYNDSLACSGNQAFSVPDNLHSLTSMSWDLFIFPNPAVQTTRVQWPEESLFHGDLVILDIFGRQVCRYVIPAGIRHYDLPVNNLPQGLYVVKAVVNNTGYSGKVIVKH